MNANDPLVSIVIPVYNGANFVGEAIESALNQTYKNVEIIVVNDGSTDNGATEKAILKYENRITYILKDNGGVSSALNTGIKEMKGEYFSWLSHDDLYSPSKIESQIRLIKNKKSIVLCSGNLVDENRKELSHRIVKLKGTFSGAELFKHFLDGYILNGLGFLVPKTAFDRVGLFDESMHYLQDLDMWMRIMWLDYEFICQPDQLVSTRIHEKQVTKTASNLFDIDRNALVVKHSELLTNTEVVDKERWLQLYLLYFQGENNKQGIAAVKKMMTGEPSLKLVMESIHYRVIGTLKYYLRKVRDKVFRYK